MYRKILVPLDGSDLARAALPLGLSMAERASGELHVATAVSSMPPVLVFGDEEGHVRSWMEQEQEGGRTFLDGIEEDLRHAGASVPVASHLLMGPPVRALTEHVKEHGIDLIVMTTHGRGALQRMWLGSVADGLVRTAPCPILLWRRDEATPELGARPAFGRILVPLDGSGVSEAMLPEAMRVARAFDASLSLVAVAPPSFPLGSTYIPHAAKETRERGELVEELGGYLEGVAERVRAEGLSVDAAVVADEDIPGGILARAAEVDAELLAMSTHGRGGVARMVLGSVADKVIRSATLPVLVHRHAEDEDEG